MIKMSSGHSISISFIIYFNTLYIMHIKHRKRKDAFTFCMNSKLVLKPPKLLPTLTDHRV